ncbi:Oxidoreductase [Microbotryomycetes sp. JL201]|nr:Oxidoreductase [Microbotryomycetes sp. JL201]
MTGVQIGALGLVALTGWSAVLFAMGNNQNKTKEKFENMKHKAQQALPSTPSTSRTAEPAPSAPPSEPSSSDSHDETSQQAAFNPETGEINWDCPCLGGMAHGPCGEEFKAAFSCFVYSEEEVKGVDCVDKFRGMQECFRRHPDVYGSEIDDEDEDDEFELISQAEAALKDDEPIEPKIAK